MVCVWNHLQPYSSTAHVTPHQWTLIMEVILRSWKQVHWIWKMYPQGSRVSTGGGVSSPTIRVIYGLLYCVFLLPLPLSRATKTNTGSVKVSLFKRHQVIIFACTISDTLPRERIDCRSYRLHLFSGNNETAISHKHWILFLQSCHYPKGTRRQYYWVKVE